MRFARELRLLSLVGIGAMLSAVTARAKFPPQLDRWCVDHPTLAEEIESASQSSTVENRHLRVVTVTFEGAVPVPESVKTETTRALEAHLYRNYSDLLVDSQDTLTDALKSLGYLYASVSAAAGVVSSTPAEERVAVTYHVTEGKPYRLSEVRFSGAQAFSSLELRQYVPMQDGGLFQVTAMRKGIEALTRFYGNHGYLNITISPDITLDNRNQLISLTLHLEEDQQFRVGSIEVLGLDRPLSGETLKTKLLPGKVFSSAFIDQVFDENKSYLPADASPRHDLQITQNPKNTTVAIRFDFRRSR